MKRESGQAIVESALTLPLTVFLILGTLQLSTLFQGRMMAQLAAFRATRAGSVTFGDCSVMTHAAIGAVLPSFTSYLGPSTPGATPVDKVANAFFLRRFNKYDVTYDNGHDRDIVWIFRELPLRGTVLSYPGGEDDKFDVPSNNPTHLEVRLVYWFPLKIPFANWVMTRMALAHFGLLDYTNQNPLLLTEKANWTSGGGSSFPSLVASELMTRYALKQYVFPIETTYTMRMMTPPKASKFATQNCPPLP